jgi:thioredoxin 1
MIPEEVSAMSQSTAVTSADFDSQVLQSEVPVLVDFWAAWCGPCRRVAPEVDAVASQFGEQAKVVKVDIDAEPDLAARYGIQSIPALFIFKGGRVVDQLVGAYPRTVIAEKLSAQVSA